MRHTPVYDVTDPEWVRRLIREHPWVMLVSHTSKGLVASHYPVLVAGEGDEIVIETHLGRPDEQLHELGQHEVLMVFEGPHGYISSSWYQTGRGDVPTWNFAVAHLWGTPEILSDAENLAVLERLTDAFEAKMPEPRLMRGSIVDSEYADRIAKGTVGIRMRAERWSAKNKMSQNRTPEDVQNILAGLDAGSPYADPRLGAYLSRAHAEHDRSASYDDPDD